jgi:hypothetical protein
VSSLAADIRTFSWPPTCQCALQPDNRAFANNYAFLFIGYKYEAAYWEVIVMLRKAVISLVSVTVAVDRHACGQSCGFCTIALLSIRACGPQLVRALFVVLHASHILFRHLHHAKTNGVQMPLYCIISLTVNLLYFFWVIMFGIRQELRVSTRAQQLTPEKAANTESLSSAEVKDGSGDVYYYSSVTSATEWVGYL